MNMTAAPGVLAQASRMYVTEEDVMVLLGCGKSKAYTVIREINGLAKKRGKLPFAAGKANKYTFSDALDIPIEEVEKVINRRR